VYLRRAFLPPEGVTYLIVGVDRNTFARWHGHVLARDIGSATALAGARAADDGINLVVAAVIGPNSAVLDDPAARAIRAA
jgi:hypothetical protein